MQKEISKSVKADIEKIAFGVFAILKEMEKDGAMPRYPIRAFREQLIAKGLTAFESADVIEQIINTGIIAWEIGNPGAFVLPT